MLIFTDPASGEQHGYYDGWQPDGCFHYTGEGQRGDQRMVSGNRSILDHEDEGRALRLFKGARGEVEYVGEFVLDDEQPWYETDAPETGGGPLRKVIVFRLRPVDTAAPPTRSRRSPTSSSADVVQRGPDRGAAHREDLRRARPRALRGRAPRAGLVQSLRPTCAGATTRSAGCRSCPTGEYKPLFTDLYDKTADLLVEAKGIGDPRGDPHGDRPARRLRAASCRRRAR